MNSLHLSNMPNMVHNTNQGDKLDINNMCMLISTVIASYLMNKFKLDTLYYCMLQTLMLQLMIYSTYHYTYFANIVESINIFGWANNNEYIYYSFYAIIIVISISAFYFRGYDRLTKKDYITINIYDSARQDTLMKYFKNKKENYDISVNTDYGDIDSMMEYIVFSQGQVGDGIYNTAARKIIQTVNSIVRFKDDELKIEGYYNWKSINKKDNLKPDDANKNVHHKETTTKFIEFNILKKEGENINPDEIMTNINNYVKKLSVNSVSMTYTKMLYNVGKKKYHSVNFYDGEKIPIDKLETMYINTMFHQEKDRLWNLIKNGCLNPQYYRKKGQVGRASLLLHGPPGTGKSTFAYRVAMCLNRNIISLDLRNWSKIQIYEEFQYPLNSSAYTYKDYVYLFEEFDISIKDLHERENISAAREKSYYKYMKHRKYKYGSSDYDYDYDRPMTQPKVDDKKTDNNDANKDKTATTTSVDTYAKTEFTLRDLLELFQGPVPFEGMLILATTNKYDDISKLCPELFRPGRVTPVHFGYINKETLQDVSKFYFKKKLEYYLPELITIPTSQIIDIALEAEFNKNPFEFFSLEINRLLDNMS